MVRIADANLRIDSITAFSSDHQRDHASNIRLERQHLQVAHDLYILGKLERDSRRLVDGGNNLTRIFFGALDPSFDLAHRKQILIHLAPVCWPESLNEAPRVLAHHI